MKEFEPYKKPTSIEKVVATIRIDNTMLEEIDKLANEIDISRNELINQCIRYALDNLKLKDKIQKENG
jgi:metal-responsive CopG/Arc/MetJ family transcriptional regulator